MEQQNKYLLATKQITSVELLEKFKVGKTYTKIIDMIELLQSKVISKSKDETPFPEVIII